VLFTDETQGVYMTARLQPDGSYEVDAVGNEMNRAVAKERRRQADLLQVIGTLEPAGRLHGRQKQGDQDADDRDHDQQLDQRKGSNRTTPKGTHHRHFRHVRIALASSPIVGPRAHFGGAPSTPDTFVGQTTQ